MVEKLKQNIKNILMSQGMFLSFEKREVLDLELKGYLLHVHNRGHTRCTCMYKKNVRMRRRIYLGMLKKKRLSIKFDYGFKEPYYIRLYMHAVHK